MRLVLVGLYILFLVVIFIVKRAFWTPDLIFAGLFVLFALLGQGKSFAVRFLPFVLLLLSYEKLRSLASYLNKHVHYLGMPHFDQWLFHGVLPTAWLQQHFYHGHIGPLDMYFYFLYTLHFVTPLLLAVAIWKAQPKQYWFYMTSLLVLSYAGFITYVLFPAAPPWLASDLHLIQPIHHLSSDIWGAFGVKNFSEYYNHLSANLVAAMPSLHAAYPTLFALMVRKIWGTRWFIISLVYPISIWVGVVYLGEHYVADVLAGIVYAIASYLAAPWVLKQCSKLVAMVNKHTGNVLLKWSR